MKIFSERLKAARGSRFTQVQMAAALGITARQYQRYEAGTFEPSLDGLVQIADLLCVSTDYLCGRSDEH